MSFASDVKKEIIVNEYSDDELKAELYGFLKLKSDIIISANKLNIKIRTTSIFLARRLVYAIKRLYKLSIDILSKERHNLDYKSIYIITINDDVFKMLQDLDIISDDYNLKREMSLNYDNNFEDVFRGMFLAAGSINDPNTNGYHFEISCNEIEEAKYLLNHLQFYGIQGKICIRKKNYVFYIKRGEHIGDSLKLLKASSLLFDFEDCRIKKDLSNVTNRVINCDAANGMKAMQASDEQMKWIRIIQKNMPLDQLSLRLNEAIILRVKNEGSSLQELSDVSEEVIGRYISKSALAHCMRDLESLAMSFMKEGKKDYEKAN